MRRLTVIIALVLVVAACGDDDGAGPDTTDVAPAETTTTDVSDAAAPETTTTTAAPTTTQAAAARFTVADIPTALLQDGDPWVIDIANVVPIELSNDDIWPLDSQLSDFSDENAAYVEAGFLGGGFSAFTGDQSALVVTLAHVFEDADGAQTAFDILTASHNDLDLLPQLFGLSPGDLDTVMPLDDPGFGDDTTSLLASGPSEQVVVYIWVTGNLVQVVRVAMPLGDEDRTAAVRDIADALAERTG